jgi:HAE1 family hydrophobic/amphiphilic exporter-1
MAQRMEALLDVVLKDPAVDSLGASIGPGGATATLNQGRVFIALKPHDQRDASIGQVITVCTAWSKDPESRCMQAAQDITLAAAWLCSKYQYTLTDADRTSSITRRRSFSKPESLPKLPDVASDQENGGPRLNATVNRDIAWSLGSCPQS